MIQVGQVLDKYELLERVGQGGMAVVYRGLDRSLKRVVAVKILHKHLSDYQEARDRFEREAQAVAKLRHENILEIFDYSGSQEAEDAGGSYIVTEFIDGATLKQVITDRPITFPEVGAMVVLQVARALAHAHSVKILHRDVKPENIMIRNDGVVKLMDFGISHMVDLERLTVTGQLLGSPAYMAPEHVEGRPIDFRTDVFAVGIVLYQLTTGKLPFEGKNPHEVLKRIAECRFIDPRQVNPRIGNRLGRIILRAMAADPNDRFPAIGEMVSALESYLDESGLASDKIAAELGRYFQAPAAYEAALEARLVDTLTRRGQKLLGEDDRAGALDAFDRVLTIDTDNAKVIAILDGINRRMRYRAWALAALAASAVVGGALLVHRRSKPAPPPEIAVANDRVVIGERTTQTVPDRVWPAEDMSTAEPDAGVPDVAVVDPGPDPSPDLRPPPPDAAPTIVTQPIRVRVVPSKNTQVKIGDGAWQPLGTDGSIAADLEADTTISVKNPCCGPEQKTVKLGQAEVLFNLQLRAGAIVASCAQPGAIVTIDRRPADLGQRFDVFFRGMLEERMMDVEFITKDNQSIPKRVKVFPGKTTEVSCEP